MLFYFYELINQDFLSLYHTLVFFAAINIRIRWYMMFSRLDKLFVLEYVPI